MCVFLFWKIFEQELIPVGCEPPTFGGHHQISVGGKNVGQQVWCLGGGGRSPGLMWRGQGVPYHVTYPMTHVIHLPHSPEQNDRNLWKHYLPTTLFATVINSDESRIRLGANLYLPPANEVWGKVIFSVACVKVSVHGGCLVPGEGVSGPGGGFWSQGDISYPAGGLGSGCVCGDPHSPPRWLLLRAVRILLECILV